MWSCRRSQGHGCGGRLSARAHSQCMADRVCQLRTIQGVEVEIAHAVALERVYLLDGDAGGDETASLRVVIEPMEPLLQPARNVGAATVGHAQHLWESRDRQDAWHDGRPQTGIGAKVAKAQEGVNVVKELRDRARRAGIQLA